jgi:membrane protein DedA with SNARE-associated domain
VFDKAALLVYAGVFSALIACGLGFPIPEEVPIVTGGALAGHAAEDPPPDVSLPKAVAAFSATPLGGFPTIPLAEAAVPELAVRQPRASVLVYWWIMLPLCILGVVIGDGLLYTIGRYSGPQLLDAAWIKRLVSTERRQRIEDNFRKYGVWVLLFARFLPTIRGPIFITAGIMRLSLLRFLLADGIYAIPGVSLLFFLAFWFGDQFRDLVDRIEGRVHTARPILVLLLLVAVALYLVYHFLRHPVATGDPREEIPVIGGQVAKTIVHADLRPAPSADGPEQKDSAGGRDHSASSTAPGVPNPAAKTTGE